SAGAHVFTASIEADSIVEYELRVVPVSATGATRPIGASATLTLTGAATRRVAIVPSSWARSLDPAGVEGFAVRPGTYRVLLVRDTTDFACRLPCTSRRPFPLRPGRAVTLGPCRAFERMGS